VEGWLSVYNTTEIGGSCDAKLPDRTPRSESGVVVQIVKEPMPEPAPAEAPLLE
jgi:hypothetical protein